MNDRIHELLHRNLQEVFGEGDAARRRAAIEELYTEDCVLEAPDYTGLDVIVVREGKIAALYVFLDSIRS